MRSNRTVMDEYDAFGRKRDENPLSDLGWGATGEPPPPVEQPASPAVSATDWTPAVPAPSPAPRRRRSGSWLRRFIALDVTLLVIGGVVFLAVDGARDTIDGVRDTFTTSTTGVPDTITATEAPPPQAAARKLLTPPGFKRALVLMARDTPGRIQNLRLDAERISYQVQRGATFTIANFEADAQAPVVSVTQERAPATGGIGYRRIDATAPVRIIRGAGARLNRSRADVDYLVLQDAIGVRWVVYFKGGRYAIGDARGRVTAVY